MSMREKTQADFDLERMFEMLDTALTSKDERVQSALRALLTIVALTKTQDDGRLAIETSHGPLRQMQEDLRDISRRLQNLDNDIRRIQSAPAQPYPAPYTPVPGAPYGPYVNPAHPSAPGTWWGPDPNGPWTTGVADGVVLTGNIGHVSPQTKAKELK